MIAFTGSPLDRAEALRRSPAALAAAARDPAARWLLLDELRPVMAVDGAAPRIAWAPACDRPETAVLLGLDAGAPRFAAEGIAAPPWCAIDARSVAAQCDPATSAIIAHARSLLHWHGRNGFCGACGAATTMARGGQIRRCSGCTAEHYPRTDPVAIMLVASGDLALIGRGATMPPGFYSALAGFVEPGESLEEAVRREVMEEAGVRVGAVRYALSQPWPFASQLMLGCHAEALDREIRIDRHEIEDARWVSRAELAAALAGEGPLRLPPPLAIAHHLIRGWVENGALSAATAHTLAPPARAV